LEFYSGGFENADFYLRAEDIASSHTIYIHPPAGQVLIQAILSFGLFNSFQNLPIFNFKSGQNFTSKVDFWNIQCLSKPPHFQLQMWATNLIGLKKKRRFFIVVNMDDTIDECDEHPWLAGMQVHGLNPVASG
jgi:hypothetical protein